MTKFTIFPKKESEKIDPREAVKQEGDGTAYNPDNPQQPPATITKQHAPQKRPQHTH